MKDSDTYNYLYQIEQMKIPMIKEELAPYLVHKMQGDFTIEDYYNLPDDQQVELIDGTIYDMSAPTTIHQIITNEINIVFSMYIKSKKGTCLSMISPTSVQLDCNDKTMIQPDVLIICDKNKLNPKMIYGAPDLIVEVLSPSTRQKDITIKTGKYRNAGVLEYWIVDPMNKRIHVYEFGKINATRLYTFEDKVPVGIWNDECVVDFKEINEYISFLKE